MATYLYLPVSGSAAVSVTADSGDWDGHINTVARPLNFSSQDTARAYTAYSPDAGAHLTNVSTLCAQFVSQVLPPQTVPAQEIRIAMHAYEVSAENNLFLRWKLYGVSEDGSTDLGDIVPIQSDNSEFNVQASDDGKTDSINPTSEITFNEPWRMVLEVGWDGLPTGSGNHNGALQFGENQNSPASQAGAGGSAANSCVVFEQDIALYMQPPSVNRSVVIG